MKGGQLGSWEPSGKSVFAPEKETQKKITSVLIWILSCLNVTLGSASAFLGSQRVTANVKASMLRMAKQEFGKNFIEPLN